MTHWEQHKKEIDDIWGETYGQRPQNIKEIAGIITVRKDGTPKICTGRICCSDCIFDFDAEENCIAQALDWLKSETEPEKEEKKMNIGDKVKVVRGIFKGCDGKIVDINMSMKFPYRVEVTKDDKKQEMFYNADNLELIEKDEIKIGDKIIVTNKNRMQFGKVGVVKNIISDFPEANIIVQFGDNPHTYPFSLKEIEKIRKQHIDQRHKKKTPPRIVIYRNGNTVTVKDLETWEEAKAVCSDKDDFDFFTGAFIALSRLTGFDRSISRMVKEFSEVQESIDAMKSLLLDMEGK